MRGRPRTVLMLRHQVDDLLHCLHQANARERALLEGMVRLMDLATASLADDHDSMLARDIMAELTATALVSAGLAGPDGPPRL